MKITELIKKPDIVTLLNASFGSYSIFSSYMGNFDAASRFILLAFIADGIDGWWARLKDKTTDFGVNLDSLSDCISFGVAPALLIWSSNLAPQNFAVMLASIALILCGVLRLARFNILFCETEGEIFIGLPIPAIGLLFATLWLSKIKIPNVLVVILAYLTALLMISTVSYPNFKGIINDPRGIFMGSLVGFTLLMTIILPDKGQFFFPKFLFVVILLYVCVSPLYQWKRSQPVPEADSLD
ncbi:MAG: CDP-diacylglycerol--serine O-phosphatidyltransferase [Candidatus Hydrothermarchaeota archaeon]